MMNFSFSECHFPLLQNSPIWIEGKWTIIFLFFLDKVWQQLQKNLLKKPEPITIKIENFLSVNNWVFQIFLGPNFSDFLLMSSQTNGLNSIHFSDFQLCWGLVDEGNKGNIILSTFKLPNLWPGRIDWYSCLLVNKCVCNT